MGTLIVDTIGGRNDNAPNQSDGLTVTGVCSATDFSGLVGGAADFPNGLTATTGTFSGNVSVGGTLTYDDVTNVDSVGVITARGGLKIGPSATGIAGTIYATGDAHFIGIVTAGSISGGSSVSATTYYGDASNMDNAGISACKSVALAAFLGC